MARNHCRINCGTTSKSEATVFGNLDKTRKNIKSTNSEQLLLEMEKYPPQKEREKKIVFEDIGL